LHLRFLINSNSFYFGSLIFSYIPLYSGVDEVTLSRTLTSPVAADFVEILQRPYILLDPTTAQDKEMVLPFFYPYNYYTLTADTSSPSSLGTLVWNDLNILRHANGGTDPVQVSVFAWLDEADFVVPTTYTSTSETVRDIEEGPGTKVCSALLKATTSLSAVPGLSPYFTPIQAASSLGYDLAKKFGFSRPENSKAPARMRPGLTQQFAVTDASDTAETLALDSANTLTIDPRSVNLEEDEMDLLKLCKRPSFILSTTIGLVAVDSVILSLRVRPVYRQINSTEYHYPIISYCSLPFQYWRGTLKYTFQFVASAYHKGRFRIVWDPYPSSSNTVDPSYFNTVYTQILDLEADRELTFIVPYAHYRPYQSCFTSGSDYSTSAVLSPTNSTDNGVITITMLNPLVSPNTTSFSPIYLNVYVSAGDDFRLVYPVDSSGISTATFFSTSATDLVEPLDNDSSQHESILFTTAHDFPLDVNGENIMDLRALTKRVAFCYSRSIAAATSSNSLIIFTHSDYDRPIFRGKDPGGAWTNNSIPMNLSNNGFINWFEPCFAGRKGGYKVKYIPHLNTSSGLVDMVQQPVSIKKTTISTNAHMSSSAQVLSSYSTGTQYNRDYYLTSNAGQIPFASFDAQSVKGVQDTVLDVSLPFYGNRNFLLSRTINNPSSTFVTGQTGWGNATQASLYMHAPTGNYFATFSKFISTREDYSLFFFVSTPVVYFTSDPTPV